MVLKLWEGAAVCLSDGSGWSVRLIALSIRLVGELPAVTYSLTAQLHAVVYPLWVSPKPIIWEASQ